MIAVHRLKSLSIVWCKWVWSLCKWGYRLAEDANVVATAITAGCVLLGAILSCVALKGTWFDVPVELGTVGPEFELTAQDSKYTKYFKVGLGLVLTRFVLSSIRLALFRRASYLSAWQIRNARYLMTWIAIAMFFPACVINLDHELSGHAAWLDDQNYNLTWLGGDVYNNAEGSDDITKSGMVFSSNPLRIGAYPLPEGHLGGLHLANFQYVLQWFGYGTVFTQFEGTGWMMSILGPGILTMGLLRISNAFITNTSVARRILWLPFVTIVGLTGTVLGMCLLAGELLTEAQRFHAVGDYRSSLQKLDHACRVLPIIRAHSQIVGQRGYLLYNLDQLHEPEAQLIRGVELEALGMLSFAEQAFWRVLESEDPQTPAWQWSPASREAFRALTRAGIEDLNSGQSDRANEMFNSLLSRCSVALKVTVAQQYALMQAGRAEETSHLVTRIRCLYDGFDALEKRAVLSLAESNAARAHFLAGNSLEMSRHHRKSIRP